MAGNAMTVTTPGLEIVMTRSFNAPRELVFEAHTSCEHMRNWWGPRKYDVAECELDFRPGGKWRIVHKGDGQEIAFFGEYREIDRPSSFTWTFGFDGMPGDPGVEHYSFEETDGVTTLTASAKFSSAEERDAVLNSGMQEGAAETWDRLDEYLETLRK
jgi:uncharacterized protein YndB with AHSA1/START domain